MAFIPVSRYAKVITTNVLPPFSWPAVYIHCILATLWCLYELSAVVHH